MVYLEFHQARIAGHTLSFRVESGRHVLLSELDYDGVSAMIDAALGIAKVAGDAITLLGERLIDCSPSKLRGLRSRVGVISESRGLISNLKVWENVHLPLEYHAGPEQDLHATVTSALQMAGFTGDPYAAPDTLSSLDRKQVLMARAFVNQPPLLIIDNLFEGHSNIEKHRLLESLDRYFKQWGRAAGFFLSADVDKLLHFEKMCTVSINHEGEYVL